MARIVIISGLSGSGKSTVQHALADTGYYTVDNLPAPLIEDFIRLTTKSVEAIDKIAFVVDARSRDYLEQLPKVWQNIKSVHNEVTLIYLESNDKVLTERFRETRRRHPLSPDDNPLVGVKLERKLLSPIRELADVVLDTSDMSVHDLKKASQRRFDADKNQGVSLQLTSFGFKHGSPPLADLLFDVRFLPNPFFQRDLRDLNGLDENVSDFVLKNKACQTFLQKLNDMLDFLLPNYESEGKAFLHISIGCTGGQHRSVAVTESLKRHLEKITGQTISVEHRDIQTK